MTLWTGIQRLLRRNSFVAGPPAIIAAPAGGAWKQGRGCAFILTTLMTTAAPAWAEDVDLPSGYVAQLHDRIDDLDASIPAYRFRFVLPEIAGTLGFEDVATDMEHLCVAFALPRLLEDGLAPTRIVIAVMSEPTEFGVINSQVTQFFESYRVESDLCIWEVF